MIPYYQLYAKNIHLFHFWHFTERHLDNPVHATATTKQKIHCNEHLQLTHKQLWQLVSLLCPTGLIFMLWIQSKWSTRNTTETYPRSTDCSWSFVKVWRIVHMKFVNCDKRKSAAITFTSWCSNTLQVTWNYLINLHCKFPCESDDERISKSVHICLRYFTLSTVCNMATVHCGNYLIFPTFTRQCSNAFLAK